MRLAHREQRVRILQSLLLSVSRLPHRDGQKSSFHAAQAGGRYLSKSVVRRLPAVVRLFERKSVVCADGVRVATCTSMRPPPHSTLEWIAFRGAEF